MKHSIPKKIVLIGSSTGGPGQIAKIIATLPQLHDTSVLIAQHMVEGFFESFAQNLNDSGLNSICVIKDKDYFEAANIYVCEGETKLEYHNKNFIFSQKEARKYEYNPNINTLFYSFVKISELSEILAVILTGIGDDGVEACIGLSKNSVRCITESQKSAIVDGMPSRARSFVPHIEVYDMQEIVNIISEFCQ
ncbi:chemotaxis protein CheB [Sulfurimonas sp.]